MKIGIQTWGSRGDLNPWIALGQGLQEAGHDVTLFYTSTLVAIDLMSYSRYGLEVKSTREFSQNENFYGRVMRQKIYKMDPYQLYDYMRTEFFIPLEPEVVAACESLCNSCDVIISNPIIYQSHIIAEKNNTPLLYLHVDNYYLRFNHHETDIKDSSHDALTIRINDFREAQKMKPIQNVLHKVFKSEILNLLNYSRVFGNEEKSWDASYKICGYMEVSNAHQGELSSEIQDFLEQGKPPIFFSMGSIVFFEGEDFDILDIFLEAIELSGCRAIIQASWDSMRCEKPTQDHILSVDYVPHELVFPKCAGVVHHGGAGTTHTTLLHGTPSIVIAYAWDQFSWGTELIKLGVSPGYLKRIFVDALQLAGAIKSLTLDQEYKQRAEEIRRKIKRERGVTKAVKLVEECVRNHFQSVEPKQPSLCE